MPASATRLAGLVDDPDTGIDEIAEVISFDQALTMKMLAVLQTICGKMEKQEAGLEEDIRGVIEFLRIFVDRCHHGKEEDVLFPALEELGVFDT